MGLSTKLGYITAYMPCPPFLIHLGMPEARNRQCNVTLQTSVEARQLQESTLSFIFLGFELEVDQHVTLASLHHPSLLSNSPMSMLGSSRKVTCRGGLSSLTPFFFSPFPGWDWDPPNLGSSSSSVSLFLATALARSWSKRVALDVKSTSVSTQTTFLRRMFFRTSKIYSVEGGRGTLFANGFLGSSSIFAELFQLSLSLKSQNIQGPN